MNGSGKMTELAQDFAAFFSIATFVATFALMIGYL